MTPSNEAKAGVSYLYRGKLFYLIPLVIFVVLAIQVTSHQGIFFDKLIMSFFGNIRTVVFDLLFKLITELGSSKTIMAATFVVCGALVAQKKYRFAIFLPASVIGAGIIDGILKELFRSPRPMYLPHLVIETGFGFPSGHSMVSSAFALAIIFMLWHTRWRKLSLILGIGFIAAVGISRIYLGVHYPSDVLGGWCVSILWVGFLAHFVLVSDGQSYSGMPAKTAGRR